jgi:hypothetical protein
VIFMTLYHASVANISFIITFEAFIEWIDRT